MGKDKGRGKRGGGTGRLYIENEEEMALRDAVLQMSVEERLKRRQEVGEDDGDDEKEDGKNEHEFKNPTKAKTKAGVKATKKTTKEIADDEDSEEEEGEVVPSEATHHKHTVNPNHAKKAVPMDQEDTEEVYVSRREREAAEAAKKKADYDRRHAAGETEQAKTDLARLALVRQRREEARVKRESEGRAPGWVQPTSDDEESGSGSDDNNDDSDDHNDGNTNSNSNHKKSAVAKAPVVISEVAAKKKAAAAAVEEPTRTTSELPKLKSMDIKKMNADAVKDHLKVRNLSTQGQKKDLMQRLIDFENARP